MCPTNRMMRTHAGLRGRMMRPCLGSLRGWSLCQPLSLALAVFVVALGGCALIPWTSTDVSTSSVGGTLELHDATLGIDLSVRLADLRLTSDASGPPGYFRTLRVHLIIRNLGKTTYHDSQFYDCASLTKELKPSPESSVWSPDEMTPVPPHAFPREVTIPSGGVLDGWFWFDVAGTKHGSVAPDFGKVHVLWFHPAGGASSALGSWQLRP
jgi:hypothetical protein